MSQWEHHLDRLLARAMDGPPKGEVIQDRAL